MTDADGIRRKLTTIFCADVQGYSALVEMDEVGTVTRLKQYREVMVAEIERHHGRLINTWGDGLLAEFSSPVEAVFCAVETQRRIAIRNEDTPQAAPMQFRIGINIGDVMIDGNDIYGEGVNIAARLESLAEAGGICISGTVFEQVRKKLDIGFAFIGEREIKNIAEPVPAYRVLIGAHGLAAVPHRGEAVPQRPAAQGPMPQTDAADDPEAKFAVWRQRAWRYGVVLLLLAVINLATSPGRIWFFWPMIGVVFILVMKFPAGIDPRRLWPLRRN